MKLRWFIWLVTVAALLVACSFYASVTVNFDSAGIPRVLLSATIGVLGIISLFTLPSLSKRGKVVAILSVSALARISLLPAAPSDDINRYLWEGKIDALGISPYQAVASDPVYTDQRDEFWHKMNHIDKPTAYPPLAMMTFQMINKLGYDPMSYKVTFMLLDLFLIAALLALLDHHRLPLQWSMFYALSPISLLSFAAEGHFDVLMVAAVVFSLLALSKRWFIACGVAVGIAVGAKIMALIAAPLILWRAGVKGIVAALVTFAIPLVFYWGDLISILNGLFIFGSKGRFNGPVHQLLSLLGEGHFASLSTAIAFVMIWFFAFWLMLKGRLWSSVFIAFGSLVILSPVVHFWYLTWIFPLVALRPKLSWVTLSVSFSLYFLVWDELAVSGVWDLPLWAKWCFWLPFFVLLLLENRSFFSKLGYLKKHPVHAESPKFSIVIPTYNPGEQLQQSLMSLGAQTVKPQEVIIADASEEKGYLSAIDTAGLEIKVIDTAKGRGSQIKSGVEKATEEWVVIVHADATLPANALETISKAIEMNPSVLGGSLGQRFNSSSPGLLLIEAMNEYRATLMMTSFGDQNQFFHRQTAVEFGILTEQPLMEDVEMSDRLNKLGDTLYLATEGSVSAKKWNTSHFTRRFFTIIEFCVKYRLLFYSKEKRIALSQKLYDRYYQ